MWNLNEENESNVEPWDADEYVDNRDVDLRVGRADPLRNEASSVMDLFNNRVVQAAVFTGGSRYDDFNEFAEENNIGNDDIISIADNDYKLVLFYLK